MLVVDRAGKLPLLAALRVTLEGRADSSMLAKGELNRVRALRQEPIGFFAAFLGWQPQCFVIGGRQPGVRLFSGNRSGTVAAAEASPPRGAQSGTGVDLLKH